MGNSPTDRYRKLDVLRNVCGRACEPRLNRDFGKLQGEFTKAARASAYAPKVCYLHPPNGSLLLSKSNRSVNSGISAVRLVAAAT